MSNEYKSKPRPNELPKGHFNMWRGLVAMVHAPQLTKEERLFLREQLDKVTMAPWQRSRLDLDMFEPQNLDDILPEIESVDDLEALMGLAVRLFHADGKITPEEQAIMNRLESMMDQRLEAQQLTRDICQKYDLNPPVPNEKREQKLKAACKRLVFMTAQMRP